MIALIKKLALRYAKFRDAPHLVRVAHFAYLCATLTAMKIKILAFGIVKEIFGASAMELELHDTNVAALRSLLKEKYPQLQQLKSFMIAVNNDYAADEIVIEEKDEVAIIPPVSGG